QRPTLATPVPLHDALPIWRDQPGRRLRPTGLGDDRAEAAVGRAVEGGLQVQLVEAQVAAQVLQVVLHGLGPRVVRQPRLAGSLRSEEHTSELQSPYDLVCR